MAVSARDREGTIIIWVVFALAALVAITALAIDIGVAVVAKQQLQTATDAAALAAASRLQWGMDEQAVVQAAVDTAAANDFLSGSVVVEPSDVVVGSWDAGTQQVVPWSPTFTYPAVQVTVRATAGGPNEPVPVTFGGAVGLTPTELTTEAVAGVGVNGGPREKVEIVLVQDASGSFEEEWDHAIDADMGLVDMLNGVSLAGDHTAFVAFNEDIAETYEWRWSSLYGWHYVGVALTCGLTELYEGEDQPLPVPLQDVYDDAYNHNPGGYTNPGIALDWALDELQQYSYVGRNQVIVLVSDGMPFGPDEATTQQYRDYAVSEADRAEGLGVRIHTVTLTAEAYGEYGYGGADFEFNASLCRNGGYAFRTAERARLPELLRTIGKIELGGPHLIM